MIYLYSGTDNYISYLKAREKLNQLNIEAKEVINADDISNPMELLNALEGVGLFDSEKALLIKRVYENKKILELLENNFSHYDKFHIVLWEDGNADSRLGFTKKLIQEKRLNKYDLPSEGEYKNWMIKTAKESNIILGINQVEYIFQLLGFDRYRFISELEKLKLSKLEGTIKDDILKSILIGNSKGDIWEFLDYFGNRNISKAIEELNKLLQYEQVQYLIAMLERELRIISSIIYCKENNLDLKTLKLNPFVLKKSLSKANKFNLISVKNAFRKLIELDSGIKTGLVSEIPGIYKFVISMRMH